MYRHYNAQVVDNDEDFSNIEMKYRDHNDLANRPYLPPISRNRYTGLIHYNDTDV